MRLESRAPVFVKTDRLAERALGDRRSQPRLTCRYRLSRVWETRAGPTSSRGREAMLTDSYLRRGQPRPRAPLTRIFKREAQPMQSGWLRQFFGQHDAQCGHGAEADETAQVKGDDDVSRRHFVKTGFAASLAAGMAAGSVVAQTSPAQAQPVNPMGRNWWPSPWGPNDEKGAYSRQTPAKAMEAAGLIKPGRIYPLSQALEAGIPLFGARHISLTIPGGPTGGPVG